MPDYKVTVNPGGKARMIRASNKRAARNHAVLNSVDVAELTTEDVIQLAGEGVKLEIAGQEAEAEAEAGGEAGGDKTGQTGDQNQKPE
jgi:hypothetical protein